MHGLFTLEHLISDSRNIMFLVRGNPTPKQMRFRICIYRLIEDAGFPRLFVLLAKRLFAKGIVIKLRIYLAEEIHALVQ